MALEVRDLADESADWSPRYDVVFFFEAVHDLPRPVEALRNARHALRAGGSVIVMDERVGALIRPAVVESLAGRAGYRATTILPIQHPFWRFYGLEP